MFEIGDFVSRKSYNNDIIFKIIDLVDDVAILKGVSIRLTADSNIDDLVKVDTKTVDDSFSPKLEEYQEFNRNDFFYLPGKILHVDADSEYLEKCMNFYKKNKIKAYGVLLKENELKDNLLKYLEMYNPDILVITGHDAYFRKMRDGKQYKNTNNFVDAVKVARKFEKSHEKLLIIAGACQS